MKLKAEKREQFGKKNKQIRRDRKIPAVIFGKNIESTPLVIDTIDFIRVYKEAGETSLIDVGFGKESQKVIVKEVQVNPVTLKPIHVGFYKVDLSEKIRANVPVEIIGEENNELVKKGEGLALTLLNEIEVEALPMNLPSNFTVDISDLNEIGDSVTAAELDYNRDEVELIDITNEKLIVKMDWAEMEEIEEEVSEEELLGQIEITEEMEEELSEEELEAKREEIAAQQAAEGEEGSEESEGDTKEKEE